MSLCVINYALRHEDVWRSGYIDPDILDLSTSLNVELHAPATLPPGKEPQNRSGRRL
jgi:hypothetical protein